MNQPPGERVAISASERRAVLIAAILASSLAFVDGTVVTVAIPQMRQSLDASFAQMQWVTNAYALTLSTFLLLAGAAGDVFGLRRVFMIGIAIFGGASLWCGASGSAEVLIAGRAAQGLGAALLVPGSLALISAHYPSELRGRAIGLWAATSSIAAALGPILGGWLIDLGSWQAIFWINGPVALAAFWISWRSVPETRRSTSVALDRIGAVLALLGLGGVAYGLTSLGEAGQTRWLALGSLGLGSLALVAFVRHEGRTSSPMMPLDLFRIPAFAHVNALTLLLYFALTGALFFLPSTLIGAHGYSATEAGSVFLPFSLVMAVLSPLGGVLTDRWGVRGLLTSGPLLTGLSFGLLVPAAANGGYWNAIVPVMLLLGLGMGITVAPLSTAVVSVVPDERSGIASAINNAVARIAGLVAVAGLGVVATLGFGAVIDTAPALAALNQGVSFGAPLQPGDAAGNEAAAALFAQAMLGGFSWVAGSCAAAALASAWFGFRTNRTGLPPPGSEPR